MVQQQFVQASALHQPGRVHALLAAAAMTGMQDLSAEGFHDSTFTCHDCSDQYSFGKKQDDCAGHQRQTDGYVRNSADQDC